MTDTCNHKKKKLQVKKSTTFDLGSAQAPFLRVGLSLVACCEQRISKRVIGVFV